MDDEKTPGEIMWLSGYLLAKHGTSGVLPDGADPNLLDEYTEGFIAGLVSVGEYHRLADALVEMLPLDTATLITDRLAEGVRA